MGKCYHICYICLVNSTEKEQKINEILTRGVEEIFIKKDLEEKLRSGKTLRVKLGFDPTGAKIHIGRAIVLRKLKAFQELGHTIVFIVGDFTAKIGDPSDKLEKRPMLSDEDIQKNLTTYKEQVGKIIDLSKAEFHYNATWLSKLTFAEIAELAESFSVQQMLARRNFKDRYDAGTEISLREFLYPLMQGYDSVAINSDVELGGFDQLFNVKAGRVIQKHYGKPEQNVMVTQMLEGIDGRKMSTSWGNVINTTDEPSDMYGKLMAVRDDLIVKYLWLTTELSSDDINALDQQLKDGENPRNIKMRLAREVVALYHGAKAGEDAEADFIGTFQKGGIPEHVEEIVVENNVPIKDVLIKKEIVSSGTEWRRLVEEGAIKNAETGEIISDPFCVVKENTVLKIGKKRFVKIVI